MFCTSLENRKRFHTWHHVFLMMCCSRKPEEDSVYSQVCKPKPFKEVRTLTMKKKQNNKCVLYGFCSAWNPDKENKYNTILSDFPQNEKQLTVYENFHVMNSAQPSYTYEDDSDTSEEEVELSYSQVNFQPKPGHQRAPRDSSSSEDTQYSQVKLWAQTSSPYHKLSPASFSKACLYLTMASWCKFKHLFLLHLSENTKIQECDHCSILNLWYVIYYIS